MTAQSYKPCPFCGGEPTVKTYPQERWGLRGCIEVSCENVLCLMSSVVAEENSAEQAADHWNRRAEPSERGTTKPEWTVRFSQNGEEYIGYLTVQAHSLERTDTGNGFVADGVRVELDEHITEVEGPR